MLSPARLLLSASIGLVCSYSVAASYISVRGNEAATASLCKADPACRMIENLTREFDNGNTFVKLKDSVARQDVVIALGTDVVDANTFMEILIKARTAATNFASSVRLVLPKDLRNMKFVSTSGTVLLRGPQLERFAKILLARAGVDLVESPHRWVNLPKSFANRASRPQFSAGPEAENGVLMSLKHPDMGQQLSKAMDVDHIALDAVDVQTLKKVENLKSQTILLVAPPVYPQNESFLQTLLLTNHLSAQGNKVVLLTPYLPYARSDKVDQIGVTTTGRLIADMIESTGTKAVSFVRAHAPQSQGFFSIPSLQVMGRQTINEFLKIQGVEMVISPDAGFQKDATLYADELGVPVGVINKQRNPETGESKLHDISGPDLSGKVVAIIDDETASGGTLAKSAELAKKKGAKIVIAVVTHLAGNAKQAVDSIYIDQMVVTDTFPISSAIAGEKLQVLDLSSEIASEFAKVLQLKRAPVSCSVIYQ